MAAPPAAAPPPARPLVHHDAQVTLVPDGEEYQLDEDSAPPSAYIFAPIEEREKQFRAEDKLISRVRIAWLIPIGGALMMLHTVFHTIIDVDYIRRRKTPPERMRSGH